MGLSWQQGPLAPGAIGRFLVPEPLPERLLYIEPLRRRMRVRFGGAWIADSENVTIGHNASHLFSAESLRENWRSRLTVSGWHTQPTQSPIYGAVNWTAANASN